MDTATILLFIISCLTIAFDELNRLGCVKILSLPAQSNTLQFVRMIFYVIRNIIDFRIYSCFIYSQGVQLLLYFIF